MSRDLSKPVFAYAKAKTPISNCAADQCLCFLAIWIVQFRYFLNPKFHASSHLLWQYSPVLWHLVGTPEDRFSCVAAQTAFMGIKIPKRATNMPVSEKPDKSLSYIADHTAHYCVL